MTQQIRVVYKESNKKVVGFIDAVITYKNVIEPTLEADGFKVASEILSFDDNEKITNDKLQVNAKGVASKV